MKTFEDRAQMSDVLIDILIKHIWDILDDVVHFEYGYETHISKDVQSTLRLRQSATAKHIRFAPDYLVYNKRKSDGDFLLEYKTTVTPRYSFKDMQWNSGQIEADALDNYLELTRMKKRVIVILYCPYHSKPLLFGKPKEEWKTSERKRVKHSDGSGTDYYNIDLEKLFDFTEHFHKMLGVEESVFKSLNFKSMFEELRCNRILQTEHHRNSSYNTSYYQTGFNWEAKFK